MVPEPAHEGKETKSGPVTVLHQPTALEEGNINRY